VRSEFDAIVEARGLWKIETVGDAYIVAGGLFPPTQSGSTREDSGLNIFDASSLAPRSSPPSTVVVSRNPETEALQLRAHIDSALSAAHAMLVR
jgi:hypothetical protein